MKRFSKYFIGSLFLSLGIALSLYSDLGAGAFDAMNFATSVLLNISVGSAMYLSIFVVFLIAMVLKPNLLYIPGFFLTLMTGFFIDRWLGILPVPEFIILRTLYLGLAIMFLPIGIACMIRSKMPLSPMDNLMLILVEKLNKSVSLVKTSMEFTFVLLAVIFGYMAGIGTGSIALGTLIVTFTIGPSTQFCMKFIKEEK
jgi:uncharacterized membrane protein YczE